MKYFITKNETGYGKSLVCVIDSEKNLIAKFKVFNTYTEREIREILSKDIEQLSNIANLEAFTHDMDYLDENLPGCETESVSGGEQKASVHYLKNIFPICVYDDGVKCLEPKKSALFDKIMELLATL